MRAVSAHVTHPNTPESDTQILVWHTVTMSDGTEMRVLAMDPPDALNKANKLLPLFTK